LRRNLSGALGSGVFFCFLLACGLSLSGNLSVVWLSRLKRLTGDEPDSCAPFVLWVSRGVTTRDSFCLRRVALDAVALNLGAASSRGTSFCGALVAVATLFALGLGSTRLRSS